MLWQSRLRQRNLPDSPYHYDEHNLDDAYVHTAQQRHLRKALWGVL